MRVDDPRPDQVKARKLISQLRKAWLTSGGTLRALSERMGLRAMQPVSSWLGGRVEPSLSNFVRLADALGYDVTLTRKDGGGDVAGCGCPIEHQQARVTRHTRRCSTQRSAERLSAIIEEQP